MAYSNKKGWYKLKNPDKFTPPHDDYMGSYNETLQILEYKSSLELKAYQFCDSNEKINKWAVEPFAIKYIKPPLNKVHRYYPDLLINFKTGDTFLVEIKMHAETIPPIKPKKTTNKSDKNYSKQLLTYSVNKAKWSEANKFCESMGIKFIFLTDKHLK